MVSEQKTVSDWTWKGAVEKAEKRLADRGLTRLVQPVTQFRDLGEIQKIEDVSDLELANLLTRHLAWYSYATVELAYAKASYASLEEIFEVKLGNEMNNVAKTQDSRVVKDVLKGMAIELSKELKKVFCIKVERQQEVELLEGTVQGLAIRCKALENESIRRASARKVEGYR